MDIAPAEAMPWLSKAPDDFTRRCSTIDEFTSGAEIQALAQYNLSDIQVSRLAKAIKKSCGSGAVEGLSPVTLGILASLNYSFIADALIVGAARHGILLNLVIAEFNQIMQQVLDPQSTLNTFKPQVVLVSVDQNWLGLDADLTKSTPEIALSSAVNQLDAIATALSNIGVSKIIYETIPMPSVGLFGNSDRVIPSSLTSMLSKTNDSIVEIVKRHNGNILDVAQLASGVGTRNWFDQTQRAAFKFPFNAQFNGLYGDYLGRLLAAIRGKVRKCLVLDLDNTLWGGVIGDDGLSGIELGQGSVLGEIYVEIQRTAKALKNRGVILAVCSKNSAEIAILPFRQHTEMVLSESDIAVFCANWTDKPSNLEFIAAQLNIGLDSLVFFDDNPVERDLVRKMLPSVAVPELPPEPHNYAWLMIAPGYFEAISYSKEDETRTENYIADRMRTVEKASSANINDYLNSLEMQITINQFDANNRARIVQLINKTNQFNLTTKRYTETDVIAVENDAVSIGLQIRLCDRFSDLGLIGVVICRQILGSPKTWEIDNFLMSCRAFGRRIEEAVIRTLIDNALEHGVLRIIGIYIATPRNAIVADLYYRLGFSLISSYESISKFELDLEKYDRNQSSPLPFKFN